MQNELNADSTHEQTLASHRIANLTRIRKASGYLLTLNFAVLWTVPIVIQGQAYRHGLNRIFLLLYRFIDETPGWRHFAVNNVYLQSLLCMSTFPAPINTGQHGFLEYDSDGKHIPLVKAITILDGYDDPFGEDFQSAHHYTPNIASSNAVESRGS